MCNCPLNVNNLCVVMLQVSVFWCKCPLNVHIQCVSMCQVSMCGVSAL